MLTNKYLRRRTRGFRLFLLLLVFLIGYLLCVIKGTWSDGEDLQDEKNHYNSRHLLSLNGSSGGVYPEDVFDLEQRKDGAVILHVFGMVYMFVATAIVCDEFFVPSLGFFIEKLNISEDVAGATFMAAGGSAPELFISLFGVFMSRNNVGIGTIVGSAVFNILFVIGMCALVSKQILELTWWPLFRDVSFYCVDLILLIIFFENEKIDWWEALILFCMYISYVIFMKFNGQAETFVKKILPCRSENKVNSTDNLIHQKSRRASSLPILHSGSKFRQGMFQLMMHSIDPMGADEDSVHAMSSIKVTAKVSSPSSSNCHNDSPMMVDKLDKDNNMQIQAISNGNVTPQEQNHSQKTTLTSVDSFDTENGVVVQNNAPHIDNVNTAESRPDIQSANSAETQEPAFGEEDNEPLDLSWPSTCTKRMTYIFLAPIIFPLWITLPDVRRPDKKRYFVVTFIGSIFWIGFFSYLMLWWANQTGATIGIPDEVMGLTILAAGTSIPDLITSVIVAKKGFGDMAVSSSVGSNIFDITVGLPIPWLIYSAINNGNYINVDSNGLFCSIVLLFMMLLAVIITIAVSKWRMNRTLGVSMLFLYCLFEVLSVLLELEVLDCPVSV